MKKKFGLGLLVTCLLLLVSGFCIESYAYTFDEFVAYCQQIKDGTVSANDQAKTACTYLLNNESRIRNSVNVNNYTNFVIGKGYDWYFSMNHGCKVQKVSGSSTNFRLDNVTSPKWGCALYSNSISTSYGDDPVNSFTTDVRYSVGLVDSYDTSGSGYFNQYIAPPAFEFTQHGNVHNVTVGNYTDVSVIYYNPTTPIYWGILQNYNELDSNLLSYSLDIMTPDGNDEVLFDYVQWRLIDYGRYYWFTDSSKIYLNRVYKLLVNYDGAELVYTYYIAPYGSNYSDGDTIGYFYNSGDSAFDTQDATNTIVDALTDTEQVDATLDNLTSGEIYNKLGYTEYHTTWNNFMYDMFTGIETALFSSGDIAFTFPYMRTTITLHSSDFTTPPGILKGFCSTFLMFGFIVLVYQHIARFYHRLQEGAVNQVVEEFNVDDETLIL